MCVIDTTSYPSLFENVIVLIKAAHVRLRNVFRKCETLVIITAGQRRRRGRATCIVQTRASDADNRVVVVESRRLRKIHACNRLDIEFDIWLRNQWSSDNDDENDQHEEIEHRITNDPTSSQLGLLE